MHMYTHVPLCLEDIFYIQLEVSICLKIGDTQQPKPFSNRENE